MKRLLITVFLCAASLMSAATPTTHGPRKSDLEIESAIRTKLAKSKIGKDGIQVHVKNGVAIWTGNTAVMQHKGAATRMAKTAGAVQVQNNIKISDGAKQIGGPRKVQVKTD